VIVPALASRRHAFSGVPALLFAASATATVAWSASMAAMGGMPMPGGWTLSMAWMPMCGRTWAGVAVSFAGMWIVMMVAMMLPSLMPTLAAHREAVARTGGASSGRLTALLGAGYFCVWALAGGAVFPLGVAVTALERQVPELSRGAPLAVGAIVLIAGALQFTAWKARRLACCATMPDHALSADIGTAWRHGLRLGLRCSACCANLMAILLVLGLMDLGAMAAVTAAITLERLAPAGERVARALGAVIVAGGVLLVVRAL
jgi:predicted metal-binding membrane protein